MRRVLSSLSVLVVGLLWLVLPAGAAGAAVWTLAPAPCIGSSLCSPAAVGIIGDLAAINGGVTAGGATLTAAEAASFAGIAGNTAVTASVSGSQIVAAASAVGSASSSLPFIGAAVGLTTGGVAAWGLSLDGDVVGLPPGTASTFLASVGGAELQSISLTTGSGGVNPNVVFNLYRPAIPSGSSGLNQNVHVNWKCIRNSDGGVQSQGSTSELHTGAESSGIRAAQTFTETVTNCGTTTIPALLYFQLEVVFVGYPSGNGTFQDPVGTYSPSVWLPHTTVPPSAIPERTVEQTISCTNRSGSTTTVTNSSATGLWTGSEVVTLAGLMCPDGFKATGWGAKVVTEGDSDTSLGSQPSYPTNPNDANCGYVGDALCVAVLERRVSTATDTYVSCHAGSVACTAWATDVARDVLYRCRYGPPAGPFITVPLSVCMTYVDSFPADPVADPPVYSPPAPLPGPTDTGDGNCDLGWADVLNGTVIFKAVGCALVWAFVPSDAVLESVQTQVSTAWDASPPGVAIGAAEQIGAPLRDMATDTSTPDCLGPEVDWEWGYLENAHPFATCEGIPQTVSDYLRPVLIAVALFAGLRGCSGRSARGVLACSSLCPW